MSINTIKKSNSCEKSVNYGNPLDISAPSLIYFILYKSKLIFKILKIFVSESWKKYTTQLEWLVGIALRLPRRSQTSSSCDMLIMSTLLLLILSNVLTNEGHQMFVVCYIFFYYILLNSAC